MKRMYFVFLVLLNFVTKAQIITGTTQSDTGKAISEANIYIDGSKIHATSDINGNFSIEIHNLKNSNLIFQKDGYETSMVKASDVIGKKAKVIMAKIQEIEEVVIVPYTDQAYRDFITYFLDVFIGDDQTNVKIKNQKSLKFSYDSKNRILRVKAPNTLIIENKNLGYDIQYTLERFESDLKKNSVMYLGTSFFKENSNKHRIRANRLNAYYGSTMHFFQSIFNNKIEEEGFWVNHIIELPNPKYPNEMELAQLDEFKNKMKNNKSISIPTEIQNIMSRKMESKYIKGVKATKLSIEKFIKKSGEHLYFTFPEILQINFKKYYYSEKKSEFVKSENHSIQSSFVYLNGNSFEIFRNGNSENPDQMSIEGDLFNSKIGKLLPSDYTPEN